MFAVCSLPWRRRSETFAAKKKTASEHVKIISYLLIWFTLLSICHNKAVKRILYWLPQHLSSLLKPHNKDLLHFTDIMVCIAAFVVIPMISKASWQYYTIFVSYKTIVWLPKEPIWNQKQSDCYPSDIWTF